MPIPSDWKAVRSDGTIPASLLPCSQFQLGMFIRWDFPADAFGFTTIQTPATWRWKITLGSDTLFDCKVEIGGYMTILFMLGTWFPTPGKFTYYTPTSPVIVGDPTGYVSEEDGNGYGTSFSYTFFFNSPMYTLPLGAGAKLKATGAYVGGGDWGYTPADLRIRTVAGGDFAALRRPQDGTWRLVTQKSGGLQYTAAGDLRAADVTVTDATANPFSTADAPTTPAVTTALGSGTKPVPLRLPNRLALLRQKGADIEYLQSWDDGATWEAAVVVAAGAQLCAACLAGHGGTILILGVKGGVTTGFHAMFERDDTTGQTVPKVAEEFTPVLTGATAFPVLPTSLQWMEQQNGTTHLLCNRGGNIEYYRSEDDMKTWAG